MMTRMVRRSHHPIGLVSGLVVFLVAFPVALCGSLTQSAALLPPAADSQEVLPQGFKISAMRQTLVLGGWLGSSAGRSVRLISLSSHK